MHRGDDLAGPGRRGRGVLLLSPLLGSAGGLRFSGSTSLEDADAILLGAQDNGEAGSAVAIAGETTQE